MPNYFVATFAFGWPTDPVVANILIPMPLLGKRTRFTQIHEIEALRAAVSVIPRIGGK